MLPTRTTTHAHHLGSLLLAAFLALVCVIFIAPVNAHAEEGDEPIAVILLDPGHGSQDSGAVSGDVVEKVCNYKIALACMETLQADGRFVVYMSRGEDGFVSVDGRPAMGADLGVTLLFSIHCNSSTNSSANGCEVYIPYDCNYMRDATYLMCEPIAELVVEELTGVGVGVHGDPIKTRVGRDGDTYPDGSAVDYYGVIRGARQRGYAGMIVEHAFVTGSTDHYLLADDDMLRQMGQADARALIRYFSSVAGQGSWIQTGIRSDKGTYIVGETITLTANTILGTHGQMRYNFAWRHTSGWDLWDSILKSTGDYSTQDSYQFTAPDRPGKFYAWADFVDQDGLVVTSSTISFTVVEDSEIYDILLSAPESGYVGREVTLEPILPGRETDLTFNYVWRYGDDWSYWNSTVLENGAETSDTSFMFTPQRAGTYHLWLDVTDTVTGQRVTSPEIEMEIFDHWQLEGVDAPTKAKVGDAVVYAPRITNPSSELLYNYAWSWEGEWGDDWDSTVKRTGEMTSDVSSSFIPSKVGTYYVWVDVKDSTGEFVTSDMFAIQVDSNWSLKGVDAPSSITLGQSIEYHANIEGYSDELQYNYVWSWEGQWGDNWDSTVKRTGSMTSESSYSFTPRKTGSYHLWLDVKDPSGVSVTSDPIFVIVDAPTEQWSLLGIEAPSSLTLGNELEFSARISGPTDGLTYNYAWSWEGQWGDNWDSTVKRTGSMTSETSYSFTPRKKGEYSLWVDVRDVTGRTITSGTVQVRVTQDSWSLSGVQAPSTAVVDEPVEYSAIIEGSTAGLTYNYAWSWEGEWGDNWSSTVLRTGEMTSETTGSFTPSKTGTYYLWIDVRDVTGAQITSQQATVEVSNHPWVLDGVSVPSAAEIGMDVPITADVRYATSDLSYNFVWRWGDGADEYDSTVNSTGSTTGNSVQFFIPEEYGDYSVYVEVSDKNGRTETSSAATIHIDYPTWEFVRLDFPDQLYLGDSITFIPILDGNDYGLMFNYAWSWEGQWGDDWDSTIKRTGEMTSERSYTFTPSKAGIYSLWVDIRDLSGQTITSSSVVCRVINPSGSTSETPIMGMSETTVDQMVARYNATGRTYPEIYAQYGAPTIEDFCEILMEEANAEGVRAEVLFCQVMWETGWLSFGGDVQPYQCNFGGLGATGGGVAGATFPDVATGLRAQTQHLKAYASTDPLVNTCVDPRFHLITRGVAPNVEDLSGRWAVPGYGYGENIAKLIRDLLAW